jgi:hypothetical protein
MLAVWTTMTACESRGDESSAEPGATTQGAFPNPVEARDVRPTSTRLGEAPEPVSPVGSAEFDHFPRHTVLVWRDVPGAQSYIVEISYCSSGQPCEDSTSTVLGRAAARGNAYAFDFVGANHGRWRVQAVDSTGAAGPLSSWSGFRYRR